MNCHYFRSIQTKNLIMTCGIEIGFMCSRSMLRVVTVVLALMLQKAFPRMEHFSWRIMVWIDTMSEILNITAYDQDSMWHTSVCWWCLKSSFTRCRYDVWILVMSCTTLSVGNLEFPRWGKTKYIWWKSTRSPRHSKLTLLRNAV